MSDRRPRGALARAPLPVYFVATGTLFALLTGGLEAFQGEHSGPGSLLFRGVLFGGAMTWFLRRTRRRAGGTEALATVAGGIRSGELPADADPALWRPGLVEQRRQLRWAQRTGGITFAAFAVLAVVLALTEGGGGLIWWMIAAGFVVFALASQLLIPRQLAKIDRLSAELDAREG